MATDLITVVEYAKGFDQADIRRPIIEMFARSADIFEVLPFEGMIGSVFQFYRQAVLPLPGFRAINEGSTSGHGTITPLQEPSAIIDHDIDVDRAIVDRHGPERRNYENEMGMTAFGQLWTTKLTKGDRTSNPREFNGLQVRAAKYSRAQHNSAASGGAALSLAKLDVAINSVNRPTHIFAPYDSRPLWIQAARTSTLSGFVMQDFDVSGAKGVGGLKASYAGLPFLWGYPKDDHPAALSFNEVASGGGSAVTGSLYVLSIGEGRFRGIQVKPMEVRDIGLLQDGKTYRTHLSWDCGLVDEHKYSLVRLDSWTNAAIVA
ncbi:MAG: major capsid protein [Nitrobacter sp.]